MTCYPPFAARLFRLLAEREHDRIVVVAAAGQESGDRQGRMGSSHAPAAFDPQGQLGQAADVAGVGAFHPGLVVPDRPGRPGSTGSLRRDAGRAGSAPFPVPWFDNSYTRELLGYDPVPLTAAMTQTVSWLRDIGQI
jgi:hypothetical protein